MNEVAGSSAEEALIGMGVGGESWRSVKLGCTKTPMSHLREKYYTTLHIQPATAMSCLGSPLYGPKQTRHAVAAPHISLHTHSTT